MADVLSLDTDAIITITPVRKDKDSKIVGKGNPIEVPLSQLVTLLTDAGLVPEAPKDTKQYGREDGAWTEIV